MTNTNKTLNPEEFKDLALRLPEIRSQMRELPELLKKNPEKVKEILGDRYAWSSLYEISFIEQLAYLMILLGIHKPLLEKPGEIPLKEHFYNIISNGGALDQWYEKNEETINKKHLIWLTVVTQRNILSIMLFHQSLGALVDEVKHGNDEAFFKAVCVDRSILACPTFADRLARAELINDKTFYLHLRKALKGPSKKHMEAIGDLRYSIVLLRDMGFDKFTDKELIGLFVNNGLYPKSHNAEKNLRKHIQAARKFSTT